MKSIYKDYTNEQHEELLSHYLIDSWSYSRVSTFARNEKEFEMRYLYNEYGKTSATAVGGQAYHAALEWYFGQMVRNENADIVDLQLAATSRIEDVPAYQWKIQKTRPTVDKCIEDATANAYKGIENFMREHTVITDEISRILGIEEAMKEWLVVNGVSIPLPCNLVIDLIAETKEGKRVIIDHKLKSAYTDDDDVNFVIGKQAITYVLGYEAKHGKTIDEVWFVENKISKNRDSSPQLRVHKVVMDDGTRRLYEAMLYEPLRRMIEAVSNPDYIYVINDTDNYTSKAELYEFWAKTMLDEIEGFNIADNKRELIEKRQRKIKDSSLKNITPTVLKNFKAFAQEFIPLDFTNKDMTREQKIEAVLRNFGLTVQVAHTFEGYSSDTYLLEVGSGVAINNVKRYRLDIANALGVSNIRINEDLSVHEGKSYLALEAGKKNTSTLMWDETKLTGKKIPIGINNFKDVVFWDLDNHSTPHMLVCGATGSGKSVSLFSTIMYAQKAGVKDITVFDPKYEFTNLRKMGIQIVNDIEDIEYHMGLLVLEMEERVKRGKGEKKLIIFDEFADATANARKEKQLMVGEKTLEENLRLVLQKGRSTGIRIVLATQRASVKVIPGDLKVNLPVQVCFRVPKAVDSNVVIDEDGGETLMGRGDGLIKSPEYMNVQRFQGFYYQN